MTNQQLTEELHKLEKRKLYSSIKSGRCKINK